LKLGLAKRKLYKSVDKKPIQIIVVEMTSIESGLKTKVNGPTFNEIVDRHKNRFKDFKIIDVVIRDIDKKDKKINNTSQSDFQRYKEELVVEENKEKRLDLMRRLGMR